MLRPGPIGIAAQSGMFVGALLRYLSSFEEFRLSKGLGLGNKVDVDESDALSYLLEDEQTEIIGMYLEDVRDGRRFLEVARKATAKKPVLLIKGGRTREGARASASHTASMAIEDTIFEGAVRQAGILRLAGIDEFVQSLKGFLHMPLPKGGRLAFITYSGAQAIMSIDATAEQGLKVALLAKSTREEISRIIATDSKTRNPIDFFPDWLSHGFEKSTTVIMKALLEDSGVDGIIFISFANPGPEIYQRMVDLFQGRPPKPVFFSLLGTKKDIESCQKFLEDRQVPCYDFPEMAVRVFSRMWRYAQIKNRSEERGSR